MADFYRHLSGSHDILIDSIRFISLRKIPKFQLIFWCGNFVEKHSFRAFPQNFHTRKLDEISVFYAVYGLQYGETTVEQNS